MKTYEAKGIIKDVFENGFDKERYAYFIKNLLKDVEEKPFGKGAYVGNIIPQAFRGVIRKMERIGKFEDKEGNLIDILVVELNRDRSIEYARTTQRNFIRWYLNGSRGGELKDAALVAFYSKKSSDWRFSFIKMQYSLKKGKDELTPAKRSSFLVGEKGKSHTAQQQLINLLKNDYPPTLSDLEEAFNIEAVSDEFFEKYKALLFNLKEELDKIAKQDAIIKTEFEQKNIDTLNFSKKLLGQIVFLYFLQKKGWLGLKREEKYGEGTRNFMRELFNDAKAKGKNFFNDYLEFLFYDALSKKRKTDFYEKFNCRIPFLNGGLFDPINFYDWEKTDIVIPNKIFSNKNDKDEEGSGILDVFDLYNFTVKEDEPLETEVAIDPEMLGKVFERMLEVKERRSKGAFYTPREIVHYMAQQSLLYYLANEFEDKIPKEDLEIFIHYGEQIIDKDVAIETGKLKESSNKYQIPENIRKNAHLLDKALADIKICDPAVGSGAFPVGVMNEIVKLRNLLTPFIENIETKTTTKLFVGGEKIKKQKEIKLLPGNREKRNSYIFKSHAIQNSIYGVDIDAGAVEIAKLRLWLSLVVDEESIDNIKPLPNLDYKIVKGNSLVGVSLKSMVMSSTIWKNAKEKINKLIKDYYTITDKQEKQRKKTIIDEKIQEALKKISQQEKYKIDFDFKLYFCEVFNEKGGFDVVIGNPPYIQLQKAFDDKRKYADLYKGMNYQTFERTGDIYALFYEKGLELLHQNGNLCFITSNKWMRANYGKSLRKFLANKNPQILIDLGPGIFSTATVDTNILLVENKSNKKSTKAIILSKEKPLDSLTDNDFTCLKNLSEESWIILSPQEQKIKERIEEVGTPLKEWDIQINYGIKTGYNEAFIIDSKTKDELIAKDPKSAEIIKPILRGRDIKRYKAEFADLWLIATFPALNLNIDDYPAIKEYLEQYLPKIKQTGETFIDENGKKQKTRKKTGNKWFETQDQIAYYEEFEKEKIIYPNMTKYLPFILDNNKFYTNQKCFIVTGQKLKYIVSILNSALSHHYIKQNLPELQGGTRELSKVFFVHHPIPKIPAEKQKPFEILVDYILFLKSQPNNKQSFYFEQIIDGMVYELYFEKEIKQAGCEIIPLLQRGVEQSSTGCLLKPITKEMPDSEKQKIIDNVFTELYNKNHPVRKNLEKMTDKVEYVKIVEGSLKK